MADIKANGSGIIACGDEILELCKQYDEQIDDLFDSFSKINQGAWSGMAANIYVLRLALDRAIFESFGDSLKYYGKTVKKIGENVDNVVMKWEDKNG